MQVQPVTEYTGDVQIGDLYRAPDGREYVVANNILASCVNYLDVTGYSRREVRTFLRDYSTERQTYDSFLSYVPADDGRREVYNKRNAEGREDIRILLPWDHAAKEFEPQYVEGHPEWGEISL